MPARVTCLVCYRNLLGAAYGHREALATARRCLWDWEHEPVVEPASATEAIISAGPSAMQAISSRKSWYHRDLNDALEEDTVDLEDDGEPRPAS